MNNFIGDNINAIRVHYGLNQEQLANIAGVTQGAISSWECGLATPRKTNIMRIIEALPSLEYDDIMSEESGFAKTVNRRGVSANFIDIPLYGSIAAGKPIEMLEIDDEWPIPVEIERQYPRGELFALRVKGESMNRILPDGCIAIVHCQKTVDAENAPYAVCVNGYDATIKRVKRLENGFVLKPDSTFDTYEDRVFDYDIPDTDVITILGKVVYHMMPFDWQY